METVNLIVSILSGIATAVPLLIALVNYIVKCVKEKNWTKLLSATLTAMEYAEKAYPTGEVRKEYVMGNVKKMANLIGYDITDDDLSLLIESLCSMSRVINASEKTK